jgi:hypothetical protein
VHIEKLLDHGHDLPLHQQALSAAAYPLPEAAEPCIVAAMWIALATLVSLLADSQSPSSVLPCPDPAEVERQLARLGVERSARPEIVVTGDKMRVVLHGLDGETLGSREVEAPASCQERATVAAVLVASWVGVWPATKPLLTSPAATTPAVGPVSAVGAAKADDNQGYGIALALAGAFDGNAFALGIAAESNWRLHGPLHVWAGLSAFTERTKNIGPGQAGYTRPAIAFGPSLRLGHGRIQGEIGMAGQLGILRLRGKGLTATYSTTRAVPGAGTWLRLLLVGKLFSPFLSVGGNFWFGRETATLDNDSATSRLPRWDAQLGLGVFWHM